VIDAIQVAGRFSGLCSDLIDRLRGHGIEVHLSDSMPPMSQSRAIVVMADDTDESALLELQSRSTETPLLFVSTCDDWPTRLAAFRHGAAGFFTWPDDFPALLGSLDRLHDEKNPVPFRVLIVDDDSLVVGHCAAVLRGAGLEVATLTQPDDILDAMAEARPELLLLDLHLGACSGIEAAGVVRQAHGHDGIPIVFLSSERDLAVQLAALRVGGDDFLTKPISDEHLIAAVTIRASRFRALSTLMERDGLTGLLNQFHIRLRLEEMLALAIRRGSPLSFAVLDIDHFKSVNDRFGHPAGDRVLRSLARLLARGGRRSDIVGRYGGEEFAVILPDTRAADARRLLDGLRLRFGAIEHDHAGMRFHVSFSGGVTDTTECDQLGELIARADAALYRAKQGGRDRIVAGAADEDIGRDGPIVSPTADVLAASVMAQWTVCERTQTESFGTSTSPRAGVSHQDTALQSSKCRLRRRFVARLPEEADFLLAARQDGRLQDLRERLHRLRGSCGMFDLHCEAGLVASAQMALGGDDVVVIDRSLYALAAALRSSDARPSAPPGGD
jgi:diguanylate cyclase (GGDEF)-like protein